LKKNGREKGTLSTFGIQLNIAAIKYRTTFGSKISENFKKETFLALDYDNPRFGIKLKVHQKFAGKNCRLSEV
jgi:hypothetical protein